jgi:hypothetical protein
MRQLGCKELYRLRGTPITLFFLFSHNWAVERAFLLVIECRAAETARFAADAKRQWRSLAVTTQLSAALTVRPESHLQPKEDIFLFKIPFSVFFIQILTCNRDFSFYC